MKRTDQYTNKMSIAQVEACERMDDATFEKWVNSGKKLGFIDQFIETEYRYSRTGQTPPGSTAAATKLKGTIGGDGLKLAPQREATSIDAENLQADWDRFTRGYQQFVPSSENAKKIATYLQSRGATSAYSNLVTAFEKLFGQLELRSVAKVVHEPEATNLRNRKGQRKQINPAFFPRPTTSELVETVLSPAEVRALSADDTAKFLAPMSFPSITTSAEDYRQSDEFRAETPAPLPRRTREQSDAQQRREIRVFADAYPDYGKYISDANAARYDGLNQTVLAKIDEWGLLVTSQSLLDAFSWAASEGLIPKAVDRAAGQVSTFKSTPDLNPPPTSACSIKFHGKSVRDMSSAELQQAMNSSPEFRARLDSTS